MAGSILTALIFHCHFVQKIWTISKPLGQVFLGGGTGEANAQPDFKEYFLLRSSTGLLLISAVQLYWCYYRNRNISGNKQLQHFKIGVSWLTLFLTLEVRVARNQAVQWADMCLQTPPSPSQCPAALIKNQNNPFLLAWMWRQAWGPGQPRKTPEHWTLWKSHPNIFSAVFCRECFSSVLSKWLHSQWGVMFSQNGARGLAGSWLCLLWCWYQAIWHICF